MAEKILFILFAFLAIAGALGVITRTNIVHALLMLIFTMVNLAGIFLLTQAYFLAVIQILVYAGAILVLFVFVVMFLNLREFHQLEQLHPRQRWAVLVLAPIALAEFIWVTTTVTYASVQGGFSPDQIAATGGNVRVLGESLFNNMLLPFELASMILLVGMVGAIMLARKEETPNVGIREWEHEPPADVLEGEV